MRFRKLRIAWSAVCGITCLLLIPLWVRSYWRYDALHFSVPPSWCGHVITVDGVIEAAEYRVAVSMPWQLGGAFSGSPEELVRPGFQYLGFNVVNTQDWHELDLPLWFAVIIVGWCGCGLWLPWFTRFSLRTLLIATTLVAVVLGLIVYASS